jgi:bifunctional UDP-N-acetylglucosamine pyrophosphorylase/glucosamine-1-phosphate N-acetyltransferase
MQALFLAAGRGLRLRPLTDTTPKPLLPVAGIPVIERTLQNLPDDVTDIVMVVGYLAEQFEQHFGANYHGKNITYVHQLDMNGTGAAVHIAKHHMQGNFLVLNADDIYFKDDLVRLVQHPLAMLAIEGRPGNNIMVDERGYLAGVNDEGDSHASLTNCGAYMISQEFFNYHLVPIKTHGQTEFGLPQTLANMRADHDIAVVQASNWFPVGTAEQLAAAETYFKTTS